MSAQPVKVLYVGGMPRSGTTLLDLMLGELDDHVAVGELFYVWLTGVERDRLCGCGDPFTQCPFWSEVGRRAFGGWQAVDLDEVRRLIARVDDSKRVPRLALPWSGRAFERDLAKYIELMTSLYRAVASVSGSSVVVDSSKRPSLAYVLRRAPEIDVRVVLLTRDPRGVVNSWQKKVALPEGAGVRNHLKVRPARLMTRRWLTVNLMVDMLGALRVPLVRLRYEDLVTDPESALQKIVKLWPGAGSQALSFLTPQGVQLEQQHTVAGGRVRFHSSPLRLSLDEGWRTELPERQQRAVSRITTPLRRRYGYR
ncbi:sulfotransferase [Angustibacter sp. McL0619]|uniref:sulfotransferase n=1 Tax=Angustibacter sp. McL0619 TaxID=3415676 RepID=UPI003CF8F2F8